MNLLLDEDGRLVFENGNFKTVSGADEVVQRLRVRFGSLRGEWQLDQRWFFPWFDVLVKNPDRANVEALLRAEILSTVGVSRLLSFNLESGETNRSIVVTFTVLTDDGETLELVGESSVDGDNPDGLTLMLTTLL